MSVTFNFESSSITIASGSPGKLLQLVARAIHDMYLTDKPDVTFWKHVIKRHTNFAIETQTMSQSNGDARFGKLVQIEVERTADLMYKGYLVVELPGLATSVDPTVTNSFLRYPAANTVFPNSAPAAVQNHHVTNGITGYADDIDQTAYWSDGKSYDNGVQGFMDAKYDPTASPAVGGSWAYWVNNIGQMLIENVKLLVGSQEIDTMTGLFMSVWEELSGRPGARLDQFVGREHSLHDLVANSASPRLLYIPLPFHNFLHSGVSLPLVALQFHDVKLQFQIRKLNELIVASGTNVRVQQTGAIGAAVEGKGVSDIRSQDLTLHLEALSVFLDVNERDKIASMSASPSGFEQLITQHQQTAVTFTDGSAKLRIPLHFNHAVQQLAWVVVTDENAAAGNYTNFGSPFGTDPLAHCALLLSNQVRVSKEAKHFRTIQPYYHNMNIPNKHIYTYNFALFPADCQQPSGSCNFSRINNIHLDLKFASSMAGKSGTVYVFARNWNVCRFRNGLAGMAFSN